MGENWLLGLFHAPCGRPRSPVQVFIHLMLTSNEEFGLGCSPFPSTSMLTTLRSVLWWGCQREEAVGWKFALPGCHWLPLFKHLEQVARHQDGLKFAAAPHGHGGCTRLVAGMEGVLEALSFQAALPEEPLAFSLPEEWGRGDFGPLGPPSCSVRSHGTGCC